MARKTAQNSSEQYGNPPEPSNFSVQENVKQPSGDAHSEGTLNTQQQICPRYFRSFRYFRYNRMRSLATPRVSADIYHCLTLLMIYDLCLMIYRWE